MVVVAMEGGMIREVFGGVDTGEGLEVVDKVRLIEVTAILGDAGPDYSPSDRNAA